jgi:drug/metabolite transporter (DMT)-like permease
MFTAILAHLFLPSDRLHFQKIAGVALSAAGLLFLFAPNIQEGFTGSSIGMLAAASAAMSYAISHVFAKKNFTGYQPFVVPAAQMICGSLILIPVALYFENPLSLAVPSLSAILGVCGLSCFGTVLAFIIYFRLIDHCGPTAISMVACFFPVVGMLLGFIFLKESLTWGGLAASALIFLGLAIVNEAINIKRLIPAFAKR